MQIQFKIEGIIPSSNQSSIDWYVIQIMSNLEE